MWMALVSGFWGLASGSALVIGAAIGLYSGASRQVISFIMAIGAGVLISAVAFDLVTAAYLRGGLWSAAVGLAAGAVVFFIADVLVSRMGGHDRHSSEGKQSSGNGLAIAIGSLLDDIPESVAIGITLLSGGSVGLTMIVAVFLSDIPEALSSAVGLRKAGYSKRYVLGMWAAVTLVCGISAAFGYVLLANAPGWLVGGIQSFAAGAILAMLASTMMPEAYKDGGPVVGLVTAFGFLISFLLQKWGG